MTSLQVTFYDRWFELSQIPFMVGLNYSLSRFFKLVSGFMIPALSPYSADLANLCPNNACKQVMEEWPVASSFFACMLFCIFGVFLVQILLKIDAKYKDDVSIAKDEKKEHASLYSDLGSSKSNKGLLTNLITIFTKYSATFWWFFFGSFCAFSAVNGFLMNSVKMYQVRFGYQINDVGYINAFYSVSGALCTPLLGLFLSKYPKFFELLMASAIGMIKTDS